jgi:uncharacterized BrkB/YihY/UPF0761 family membrane protein
MCPTPPNKSFWKFIPLAIVSLLVTVGIILITLGCIVLVITTLTSISDLATKFGITIWIMILAVQTILVVLTIITATKLARVNSLKPYPQTILLCIVESIPLL